MPPGLHDDEPTGNMDGIDADALLEQIEKGGSHDIPMAGKEAPAEAAAPTQQEPAPASIPELEFDYNGKQIKAPFTDPRIKTWAQQGYDYSQKMAAFNQQRSEYEKQFAPYKMIDDYAKQNPQWWAEVQKAYESREANRAQGGADSELPEAVKQKLKELDEIKPFISELKQEREQTRIKQEDSALADEIKSIRDKYSNLDWSKVDESGQSLERRVLKHAVDNGIQSFKTAFHDYYHENLIKLHEERGKEQVTKEIQKRTKLGIIGESPTPTKTIRQAENLKSKSYEDVLREAKEELGIA
jgi:hypothetical protein